MKELGEEGLGGDGGGGGGLTWQQNTQIIKLSFEAYRHGKSRTHTGLNLPYLQLHTTPVCRLQFGSSLQKVRRVEVPGSMLWTSWRPVETSAPRIWHFELSMMPHDWMGMIISVWIWYICVPPIGSQTGIGTWSHGCANVCMGAYVCVFKGDLHSGQLSAPPILQKCMTLFCVPLSVLTGHQIQK